MTTALSTAVSPLTAVDDLHVPGEHEAQALTDRCPACGTTAPAVAVLDRDRGQRLAVYRDQCGERWIAHWPRTRHLRPLPRLGRGLRRPAGVHTR